MNKTRHRSADPDAHAIRGGIKQKIIGTLAGMLIRCLSWTLRIQLHGTSSLTKLEAPIIVVFWHANIIATIATWAKGKPRPQSLAALTSASKDGAIIEYALRANGISAIRGSSSRRATAALMELKKTLESGQDICITPDGPRGPARELQAGPLKLAQLTSHAIIAVRVTCQNSWKLNTWDRFEIPKPFSTIHLFFDSALSIPRELTPEEFEQYRIQLEKSLSQPADLS
jgi:lysophospholipid acyltransferase (LPLAT)-like uncharacterized protein